MASGKGTGGKMIVWGLLGLLIVSLFGFGTTNFGGSARSVASVGKAEVSVDDYARALQTEIRTMENQFNQAISVTQAEQFGVPARVISQLVDRTALDAETEARGLSVGDGTVRRELLGIEAFQGLDGNFDAEVYRNALSRLHLNERDFEAGLRKDAARNLLTGALATGLTMPPSYGQVVVNWLGERRTITVATLTPADLDGGTPIASDDDIAAHYAENPASYTLAETLDITYAWLTPAMVQDDVPLDEDALRRIYDDNISAYIQPERRLVERLVFGTEEEAQAAADRIAADESQFEDEVAGRGLTLIDADMGDVSEEELGAAGAAVFALEGLGVVGPVPTDLGPALFRVNARLEGSETTFEKARPEIAREMAADAAARLISDQLETFDDLLASGATLEELADETDMVLGTVQWREDSDADIAAYTAFKEAARQAQIGDFPEIIELSDGGVFALRLNEIIAPTLQPLDEIRDQVATDWETAQIAAQLTEKAAALESDIASGTNIDTLGLVTETFTDITRQDFISAMPEGFIDAVFAPGLDQGATTLIEGAERIVIAEIDSVAPPAATDENDAIADSYITRAGQGVVQDVIAAFAQALRDREGVTVNQAAINAVHSQLQ